MRGIKFKIWADNKFYDKCLVGNTNDINDEKWTCPLVWLEDRKEWVHCDNGIICQYTGLKDKNGNEIYEGDIVEVVFTYNGTERRGDKYIVEYDLERCGYYPFACGDGCGCCEGNVELPSKCEIIGNVHDNPELLKEGE